MNKEHWNTIIIDKNLDETLVKELRGVIWKNYI